jgi:hypothetical protein
MRATCILFVGTHGTLDFSTLARSIQSGMTIARRSSCIVLSRTLATCRRSSKTCLVYGHDKFPQFTHPSDYRVEPQSRTFLGHEEVRSPLDGSEPIRRHSGPCPVTLYLLSFVGPPILHREVGDHGSFSMDARKTGCRSRYCRDDLTVCFLGINAGSNWFEQGLEEL